MSCNKNTKLNDPVFHSMHVLWLHENRLYTQNLVRVQWKICQLSINFEWIVLFKKIRCLPQTVQWMRDNSVADDMNDLKISSTRLFPLIWSFVCFTCWLCWTEFMEQRWHNDFLITSIQHKLFCYDVLAQHWNLHVVDDIRDSMSLLCISESWKSYK